MRTILVLLIGSSLVSICSAQSSFTYSFTKNDGSPWPADWAGSSFPNEYHHDSGWGFDDPSAPADNYTGVVMGGQFVNLVGAKHYTGGTYDATPGTFTNTMAWTPNGPKGLTDNGSVPGSGLPNQIFQIGVFSSSPSNPWLGLNLSSVAGSDSFYLAGTEISANKASQTGSLNLGFYDENSNLLADFGTLNYTAANLPLNTSAHLFNFRQDYTSLSATKFGVTLIMDEYVVDAINGTTTYIGQTDFGTQTVTHGLSNIDTLTPALGIAIHDNTVVSITGASFDGGVPVVVIPEPSSALLLLLGAALPILIIRRRK